MHSKPVTLRVPAHIWAMVEAKFPWAKDDPDSAVVFLLGLAMGVWVDRERKLKEREDEGR